MLRKIINRGLSLALVCILSAAMLCGCGSTGSSDEKNDKSTQTTSQDTESNIVATGKGIEVSDETIGYYIYQCAMSAARAQNPDLDDFSGFDWEQLTENGVPMSEEIKKNAVDMLVRKAAVVKYGKDNDMTFSDEERENIKSNMEQYKTQQGDDIFTLTLNAIGINSVDSYMELYGTENVYNQVKSDYGKNKDNYIKNESDMEKYRDDDNVCVQHILIKNTSTKYDDPKKEIEEVLSRARSGEDFVKLMHEFNEDTGEPDSGYSFGHGEMVSEFEEASFNLKYDEISDIVESSYGYHIIKRIVGFAEFEKSLTDKWKITVNQEVLDTISVSDIMNKIAEANNVLMESEAAQTTAD